MIKMEEFESGAIREDKTGKGRCDLLPMCALIRLSKHYENGSVDHGERNWEKGMPMHSFLDSAIRHLFKYMDGQTDEDHLCAAAWNVLGAMWTEEKRPDMMDIPTRTGEALPRPEDISSLASTEKDDQKPMSNNESQKEKSSEVCQCYCKTFDNEYVCFGTKNMLPCTCGGDVHKCDYFATTYTNIHDIVLDD